MSKVEVLNLRNGRTMTVNKAVADLLIRTQPQTYETRMMTAATPATAQRVETDVETEVPAEESEQAPEAEPAPKRRGRPPKKA